MRKFTLTVALCGLLICWSAIPAGAASMWSQTYGGPDNDSVGVMVQSSDGGYALAGYTSSFSDDSSVLCWLVKVDSSGNMEWNRTYGGQGNISPLAGSIAMVQTSEGGYALSCYTQGTVGDEMHTGFWLVKVDSVGNMEWNKTHWREGHNVAYSLVQTGDGGYAITGEAHGGDVWLVKTDSEGNIVWNQTYGGSGFDYAKSLVQTADGGYALVGLQDLGFWSNSSGAWLPVVWLIKTDSDGNIEWNQTYGEEGTKYVQPLIQTADGGYAMAGSTTAFGAGGSDFWLIKTDSSGNIMWNKTYGGAEGDRALDLVQTSDGGYALAGFTQSFGAGVVDFWVVKTDPSGNMQWNQTYGGPDSDTAWAIVEATDGGYAIAGSTISFGAGKNDAWLIKTDEYGVIPEFPSWIILPLFLTVTLVVTLYRKRLAKPPIH
jgi:hypothetical protein